ncbi:hypothetical protein Misp01_40510 [Microtetraspora sp. NBRC 13810]|uniref:hypothetical protein n=1 Tax=Microtetraspora sp. NBRC 13810 TaxID=3030990 RepID=UPI0025524B28|nr:hypothetical protein [Microtetraspora sp. NBRC 13810]GLW08921.1 hypothetical protein Misp01_40510 [Microtetraspora sp. NBRC 13810]
MHADSPISGALVCWGNAWLTGHLGLDEAVDRVERSAGPSLVCAVGTPPPWQDPESAPSSRSGEGGGNPSPGHGASPARRGAADPAGPNGGMPAEMPLRRFLAELKIAGLRAFRLALPVAGDPLGLTGPPSFNSAAIEAGEAAIAVLPRGCVGLIPSQDRRGSSYVGVLWSALEAAPAAPDVPSLAEAEHALTMAMHTATETLASVEGPRQAHPGTALKTADGTLAPGYPARAHRVAALSARLSSVLRLADERGLTSAQVSARGDALRDLDRAVRRARVAAHHAILDPTL